MVSQPPQARLCPGSQSLAMSSCVPQLAADIAQPKEALRQRRQIGLVTGLLVKDQS
jgi:hypothetical protein